MFPAHFLSFTPHLTASARTGWDTGKVPRFRPDAGRRGCLLGRSQESVGRGGTAWVSVIWLGGAQERRLDRGRLAQGWAAGEMQLGSNLRLWFLPSRAGCLKVSRLDRLGSCGRLLSRRWLGGRGLLLGQVAPRTTIADGCCALSRRLFPPPVTVPRLVPETRRLVAKRRPGRVNDI